MSEGSGSDLQQHLEAAKAAIDIAHKTGLINRIFGLLPSSKSPKQPAEQVDYQEKALNVFRENALETLASLELAAGEALQILGPGFTFDDFRESQSDMAETLDRWCFQGGDRR